jgi:hypothetical protein
MYQYRQELNTSKRNPSIQDIRDNELGIQLLQFVRDCCTLDSEKHSDALAIKDLRVSALNALQKVNQRSNILMAAHAANFAMRLRTLEQYEGLKPEHYPFSLLQDTWISSVNASFYSEYLRKTFLEEETKIVFPNIYALLEHAKTQGLTQEYLSSSIQKLTARKNIIAVAKHSDSKASSRTSSRASSNEPAPRDHRRVLLTSPPPPTTVPKKKPSYDPALHCAYHFHKYGRIYEHKEATCTRKIRDTADSIANSTYFSWIRVVGTQHESFTHGTSEDCHHKVGIPHGYAHSPRQRTKRSHIPRY